MDRVQFAILLVYGFICYLVDIAFRRNLWLLIIIGFLLFTLSHLVLPIPLINSIADNFNKVSIGMAALITAYFGSTYFIEERSRQKKIDYYRKKYPSNQYNNTWKIIVRADRPGEPHVLEINSSIKHHIWNWKTIYDLGWQFYVYDANSEDIDVFNTYLEGDKIRTRGDLGE